MDDDRLVRVEALLDAIEGDEAATEAVAAVVDLYGEALARIVSGADPVEDELVSHLLLVHGLHPKDVETRVREALDEVRPYLRSHGGDVELVAIEGGRARLRLQGSCNGCPSSSSTMQLAIEEAVERAAPELDGIEAEGVAEPLVQIRTLATAATSWTVVGALPQLRSGGTLVQELAGGPVLFARVGPSTYAYRGPCPACSAPLADAGLEDAELVCPGCGRHYDLRRAGRCLDAPDLSLQPLPLLEAEPGLLKVALGA
jgi:Fe-S cluster biogenesis protein NfuA/nitrite reductase/ring-hydroxylating ferredoxin subunit